MPETNVNMNLINWDRLDDALAPLSDKQKYLIASLEEEVSKTNFDKHDSLSSSSSSSPPQSLQVDSQCLSNDNNSIEKIETCRELLKLYASLETKCESSEYTRYSNYLEQLKTRRNECESLCKHIENALEDFSQLSRQYAIVSGKTTSLHSATEQLISEQEKLNDLVNEIGQYTKYFKDSNFIMDKLDSANLSVRSDTFIDITEKIEKNIEFMEKNDKFKEAGAYLVKYRHCQSRVISMMHHWIMNLLDEATKSILNTADGTESTTSQDYPTINTPDTIMALLYGRFQQILPKMRPIVKIIEKRSYKRQEYDSLLAECHQKYLAKRGMVLIPSVQMGLQAAKEKYNGDHCSHVRHTCSLLLHASIDEYRLFYQFFDKKSPALSGYLESLCTSLYDSLRPSIINIIHLETLAEICCILRIEMLEEHVHNNMEALEGFGNVCLQLLHDAQERLVYRARLYLQSDIQGYNPSPGDLAYPDKLKMMEDIAESLREEDRQARIKKISVSSFVPSLTGSTSTESISSRQAVDQYQKHIAFEPLMQKSSVSNSPADLHGMWYPTVRRTLVCLSRLYRCVDRPVFQSLSHDAITFCVESVENAKEKIQHRSTEIDALLFQIKHLLILREQIAPFQVDFTVKEYSLDFSKVKTAAFGLLEKRSRLFALSNNALLEFLLEGAPRMKEHLIDSRKHVDAKLKASCQRLIQHCTNIIVEPIAHLLEESKENNSQVEKAKIEAQKVAQVVSESLRLIKFRLPSIQQSMQLYLANRETESILFRPIRNNVVGTFAQLLHFIYANYSTEDQLLIACPLPEQISVMLSSSSLAHGKSLENIKNQQQTSQAPQSEADNTTTSFADIVN